jgi:hypothetical protein
MVGSEAYYICMYFSKQENQKEHFAAVTSVRTPAKLITSLDKKDTLKISSVCKMHIRQTVPNTRKDDGDNHVT